MNEKKKWRENLLENTEWVDSVVSYSKKGEEIAGSIPAALDCFDQYNTLSRNSIGICCEADYANKFLGFWRHNNFTTDMEELATGRKERPKARKESRTEEMERVKEEARALLRQKREGRK